MTKKACLRFTLAAVMLVAALLLNTGATASTCWCDQEYEDCMTRCDLEGPHAPPGCYMNCSYAWDLCYWTYC